LISSVKKSYRRCWDTTWLSDGKCAGCRVCVKECPVDAIIIMRDEKAKMNMGK
jgi:Pyruvate/2-oxoacid:ferredoxin oxidoreductase delta subunit